MRITQKQSCIGIRPTESGMREYGLAYSNGICAESVGSQGICMHLVEIPPGAVAKAHVHPHESTVYILEGEVETLFGERLEESVISKAGEFLYIPAGIPHKARNVSATVGARAVIARTDPNDEEAAIMRPDLD